MLQFFASSQIIDASEAPFVSTFFAGLWRGWPMSLISSETSSLQALEADLAAALGETIDDIEHADCLDADQRAEVYTILKTMLTDAAHHGSVLEAWVNQVLQEKADV
jgi:hypothetical protein